MIRPLPDILVFDMDGVLVDVSASYREAIRRTVESFTGKLVSHERIQEYKNQGGWNSDWKLAHRLIEELGVQAPYAEVVDRFQRLFLGEDGDGLIRLERWVPAEGLLDRLAARFRLAIFTGRPRQEAEITLARFARHVPFDPVIADEDVVRSKPAPDGLLKIAAAAPGARLCYLGDTVDDARAARDAAVAFLGVAAPANPRREELRRLLLAEGALAVIEDINQLEGLLA